MNTQKNNIIPIVFASDDNYVPYLLVTLQSITNHISIQNEYRIFVLQTNLNDENKKMIMKYNAKNFKINFVDVTKNLDEVEDKLSLRDYYTKTTYYRFFIPDILRQYQKCLYLDCDITVRSDIANLFNNDLGDNLVGAINDETLSAFPEFSRYVEECLGINPKRYFNAGIMVMNLNALRKFQIANKFVELIGFYKFSVAQDQDYLNVLCKDRVLYLPTTWNKMPLRQFEVPEETLNLIHYNLCMKPWHYTNTLYEKSFWDCAKQTEVYEKIVEALNNYTDEFKTKDNDGFKNLITLCNSEADNRNNYICMIRKMEIEKLIPQNESDIFDFLNQFNGLAVGGNTND